MMSCDFVNLYNMCFYIILFHDVVVRIHKFVSVRASSASFAKKTSPKPSGRSSTGRASFWSFSWLSSWFALAGGASSTKTKYSAIYTRWKRWAHDHDLPALPASPHHFARYLRHLMADAKTAFPIESAVHGMSWVYHLAGERSPSEHTYSLAKDVRILAGAVFINRT